MISHVHVFHSMFIITMFHAFYDCVTDYILWVMLVWIGSLPMMQFLHHITCSVHVVFSSIQCLTFCCNFVSFFSPSLSFSLLVMAHKKFVPSKNLICHGSFSSSSTPSNSIRFRDEKARDDFFENFFDRTIHSKCQVILSEFPNTSLPGAFSSQGVPTCSYKSFTPACTPSIPLYLGLLQYYEVHIS